MQRVVVAEQLVDEVRHGRSERGHEAGEQHEVHDDEQHDVHHRATQDGVREPLRLVEPRLRAYGFLHVFLLLAQL